MKASDEEARRRVRRAPHVLCTWQHGGRLVSSARRARGVPASDLVIDVLDRLDAWMDVDALAAATGLPTSALDVLLQGLAAHHLVEVEGQTCTSVSADAGIGPWADWSPAAHLFHVATRDTAFGRRAPGVTSEAGARPPAVLPPRGRPILALPAPALGDTTLRAALRDRRTHRQFGEGGIAAGDLATLLGLTFGVQAWAHPEEGPLALKTSPSGGARHSLEAYVWVRTVDDVPSGLYHYRPGDHALCALHDATVPEAVTRWLPTQEGYEGASVLVVLASELARVAWRYRSARAYRVVLIEAGHLAQTFCLAATALGLAPFSTAAMADTVVEHDLGIDGRTQPVFYAVGVGRRRAGEWQPHAGRPAPRLEVTDLGRSLADDE